MANPSELTEKPAVLEATTNAASSHNADSDGTGPATSLLTPLTDTDHLVSPAGGDFRLKKGSSLIESGVDLSAFLTTDLRDKTRKLPFDRGPYQDSRGRGSLVRSGSRANPLRIAGQPTVQGSRIA